jgi:hypothetical protein
VTLSRKTDVLLAVWIAAWLALGFAVAQQVLALRDLSDTVVKAGVAVRSTGDALGRFGSLPLVGSDVRRVAGQAREAGRSAIVSGRRTRGRVGTLAVLLGVGTGAAPTIPVLVLYLAFRRHRYHAARDG